MRPPPSRLLGLTWLVGSAVACSVIHSSSDYDDGSSGPVVDPDADAGVTPAAPSCADRAKNGQETDVDCGGPCPKCALRLACAKPEDCQSGVCDRGVCVTAFCTDGEKNREETAADCGGPECAPCDEGKACVAARDCKSKRCDGATCKLAVSCKELKANEPELADGIYPIDPDGAGPNPPFDAFCEMTTDGGGWTFIAHLNQDFVAAKLFEQDIGTYRADRADDDTSYGRGDTILRYLLHTQTMVTIDVPAPQAPKVAFFEYLVGHPGFTLGPIPCQSLTVFGVRTALTGAFAAGGDTDKCDAQSWHVLGGTAVTRLSGAAGTTKGVFWGVKMGGDNTWGHDGYWYAR